MKLNVINASGKAQSDIQLSDDAFGAKFNESLVHQVVVAFQAGARQGTRAQKTRSEVSGGGRKPWAQKGGGRARAGSSRSPLWRGGGKTFAARPQDFSQKVNRKMYRGAMRAIFSELLRQERLVAVDGFAVAGAKTKGLVDQLKRFNAQDALIITDTIDQNLMLSARNLHRVDVRDATTIDPLALVTHEKVIVTVGALKKVEEMLA